MSDGGPAWRVLPPTGKPSYGLPLRCDVCTGANAYGFLKVPGSKAPPCPNCGRRLVPSRPKAKKGPT